MKSPAAILTLILLALSFAPATASQNGLGDRGAGVVERLMPLADILTRIGERYPGDVLEVELEDRRSNRPIYEIKLLGADGRVLKMKVDARTAEILEVRGKRPKRER